MPGSELDLIIEGCRKEDRKAQQGLYYHYYSMLMNLCMRYSRDKGEAEQLAHDSFMKIFTRIAGYREEGSFEGWLKRICINTCLDSYKRRNTFAGLAHMATVYQDDPEIYGESYVADDVMSKMSVDAILQQVEALPEKERVVFKLHVLDGYPHEEISAILGIKPNHSYWLLHSARKRLQALLQPSA